MSAVDVQRDESFRDHIGTLDDEGKRKFIYPKKPKGKLTNYRTIVAVVLLIFMFSVPWIRINGQPFLMLDVLGRKFIIFGNVYWPQDFYLLALSLITGVLFVVVFTVVFGRLFCGWMCPQTIFMEHVFRRIEYWFEGDRGQQLRLAKLPWNNPEKLRKRGLKNVVFWLISFIIANDLLMVIVGTDEWLKVVTDGPMANPGNFLAMIVFTTVFFLSLPGLESRFALLFAPMADCRACCSIASLL
jgi:polyferredoxin